MHNVQTTTGDGDVDVRVLIELAAIGVQGAEDADLDAQLARVPEQGASGAAEQVVEQRRTPIAQVPQARMRSTASGVHWLTLSPCFLR